MCYIIIIVMLYALLITQMLCLGLNFAFHPPHHWVVDSHQRLEDLCHGSGSVLACNINVLGILDKFS